MVSIRQFVQKFWLNSDSASQPLASNYTTSVSASGISAPGTQILYDANLVPRLKLDHVQLLKIYSGIDTAVRLGKYKNTFALLEAFKSLFNAHALTEYTKLYIFLDYAFRKEPDYHDLIIQFRTEMHQIGKAIRAFYINWSQQKLDSHNAPLLLAELDKIGQILVERIETEETRLYEIYDLAPQYLKLDQHTPAPN